MQIYMLNMKSLIRIVTTYVLSKLHFTILSYTPNKYVKCNIIILPCNMFCFLIALLILVYYNTSSKYATMAYAPTRFELQKEQTNKMTSIL